MWIGIPAIPLLLVAFIVLGILTPESGYSQSNYSLQKIPKTEIIMVGKADFFEQSKTVPVKNDPALVRAAAKGDLKRVQNILDEGADVNSRTSGGTTALMEASRIGSIDIVKLLLERRADVNAVNQFHQTAMGFAIDKNHTEIREILLKHGSQNRTREDVEKDSQKKNKLSEELRLVCQTGRELWEAESLIRRGADVNESDRNGETALMLAIRPEVTNLLIDKGAVIEKKDNGGKTALMHSAGGGLAEKIQLLLDRGAKIDAVTNGGSTALMHASAMLKPHCVKILIDRGANLNVRNIESRTALWYAEDRECGRRDPQCWDAKRQVTELLKSHGALK